MEKWAKLAFVRIHNARCAEESTPIYFRIINMPTTSAATRAIAPNKTTSVMLIISLLLLPLAV